MARPLDISDIQPVRGLLPNRPPRAFPAPLSLPTVPCWQQRPGSLSPAAPPACAGSVGLLCLWEKRAVFGAVCLHVLVKDVSAAGKGRSEATASQKGATWPCEQPTYSSTLLH